MTMTYQQKAFKAYTFARFLAVIALFCQAGQLYKAGDITAVVGLVTATITLFFAPNREQAI